MKKLLLILIIISATITAKADTIPVETKVTNVTVFLKGAQLLRKADVNVKKGKNTLKFENLTIGIYDKSIQVKTTGKGKILSVRFNDNVTKKIKSDDELNYDKKLKEQIVRINEFKNKIKVYQEEEKFIITNSQDTKKEKTYTFQELKEIADYYRVRLNEIKQNIINTSLKIDSINNNILELQIKYEKTIEEKSKVYSEIEVVYESSISEKASFEIQYFVTAAGWEPFYDFRVDKVSMPLEIDYNANIYQNTGEKWENVKLKLSTQNPSLSGEKPILNSWKLGSTFQYTKSDSDIDKVFETQNQYNSGNSLMYGKLTDIKTKEAISFANIVIEDGNGKTVTGAATDLDGYYKINSNEVIFGKSYVLKTTYVGYKPIMLRNIIFQKGKSLEKNIELEPSYEILESFNVVEYKVPLISLDETSSGAVYTSEEIEKKSYRGSRTGGNVTYYEPKKKVEFKPINNTVIKDTESSVEYDIDVPYTINSDGEMNAVKIQQASVASTYTYYTTPKIDNTVFLTSEITDWSQLKLLTGKASIYYQGTFTGESYFDINTADDTLKLSLGRDNNIFIKREVNKQISDKTIIGNNIKQNIAIDITIKNNKDTKVKLVVEDLYPISEVKSMDSELIEAKDAKIDDKKGFLTWTIELNPGEKRVLQFKYMIKYPKYSSIQTE